MSAIQHEDLYEILLPDGCLKMPDDPTWECSICIAGIPDIPDLNNEKFPYATLNCGHTFHLRCITKNVSTQIHAQQPRNCPNCRTDISKSISYFLITRLLPKDHPIWST